MVSEAFSLPIFEPLTSARLRKFTHVVMGCLNVAVSTAVAMSYPSVGTIHDESEAMAANIVHKSVCVRLSIHTGKFWEICRIIQCIVGNFFYGISKTKKRSEMLETCKYIFKS